MSVLNENTIIGASGAGGDYEIEQSLRFNGVDSHLTRTPTASPTSTKVWTCSFWVKRSSSGGTQYILNAGPFNSGNDFEGFTFFPDNSFRVQLTIGNSQIADFRTNALFRDPSAWYHFVVVRNNQAYAVYVNGVAQTFSMSTFGSNPVSYINATTPHEIANRIDGYNDFDGYLTEFNSIDGQALTPDSFGETGTYGEWKPKAYAGTYGTNGFYLPFEQDYTVEGFSTVVYEGNGATQYIGGTGFSPSLVWAKQRNAINPHEIADIVRGVNETLNSNGTGAGYTNTTYQYNSFDTDGFTITDDTAGNYGINGNGQSYVAWNWDMGGTTASNTSGSITSSVRANTTYGQSIVSWTGNATNASTIGHGLSSTPTMIIVKSRTTAAPWKVGGSVIQAVYGDGSNNSAFLSLNTTAAADQHTTGFQGNTATTIGVGADSDTNSNGANYIAYCFHDVANYSKFGSYSGNGSNTGTVVTTGFNPAFVMIKRSSSTGGWIMLDNTRSAGPNPINHKLQADDSGAEDVDTSWNISFLSNGFQLGSNHVWMNASGSTYIYMAFADTREYAYWYDQSGNNNDWTSEGGLTESDVMVDSPTNNFATLNVLDDSNSTVSEGNLKTVNGGSYTGARPTMAFPSSGKWYVEYAEFSTRRNSSVIGALRLSAAGENLDAWPTQAGLYWGGNGLNVTNGGMTTSPFNGIGQGDILQMAYDSDTGKVWLGVNNQWVRASGSTVVTDGNPAGGTNQTYTWGSPTEDTFWSIWNYNLNGIANFGSDSSFAGNKTPQGNQDGNDIGDFYYAPPTGFLALCTQNLPDATVIPSEHFNTLIYTGTDSDNRTITGVGFQPDFAWFKRRNTATNHGLFDSIRGANKRLSSNLTDDEFSDNNALMSFNSDGYVVSSDGTTNAAGTYVSWNWKAGGTAVSNTNGSITSSVSANPAAGFSIVSYTGSGSAGTVGTGLSQRADLIITKGRSNSGQWVTWHKDLTGAFASNGGYAYLNSTGAAATTTVFYDGTGFTSSVFKWRGGNENVNQSSRTYLSYCFHSVDGYSKVGSYTGNANANGVFVHCGFKPAFVMVKVTNGTNGWYMFDNDRDTYNVVDHKLLANSSAAESTGYNNMDMLSNGFKLRDSNDAWNGGGNIYIFLAFAENPFKHTNAR